MEYLDQQQLANLCYQQEDQGEVFRWSDKLTEDFLVSAEHRHLLAQLGEGQGRVAYLLNWTRSTPKWDWLADKLNDGVGHLPAGYDTYIIFQYREYVNWEWLDKLTDLYKDQKFIFVTHASFFEDSELNISYPNCKFVEYRHWHYRIARSLADFQGTYTYQWPRSRIISSLTSRPNFYKTLVTAYLHKNYSHRNDIVMSWNSNVRFNRDGGGKQTCGSMNFFDWHYNRPAIDNLSAYYHSVLKDVSIDINEPWPHEHYAYDDWQNTDAFSTSMINFTNETYQWYSKGDKKYPGPLFSDKTRKPLLAGCAIVPVGMPGSYEKLKTFGLRFDYPWSDEFDRTPGDLDRIEKVLETIDKIMSYDKDWLAQQLADSTEYNYHYLRSFEFYKRLQDLNQIYVEQYLKTNS